MFYGWAVFGADQTSIFSPHRLRGPLKSITADSPPPQVDDNFLSIFATLIAILQQLRQISVPLCKNCCGKCSCSCPQETSYTGTPSRPNIYCCFSCLSSSNSNHINKTNCKIAELECLNEGLCASNFRCWLENGWSFPCGALPRSYMEVTMQEA